MSLFDTGFSSLSQPVTKKRRTSDSSNKAPKKQRMHRDGPQMNKKPFGKPHKADQSDGKPGKPAKGDRAAKESHQKQQKTIIAPSVVPKPKTAPKPAHKPATAATGDLAAQMRQKLGGSRFRWINEQLYTSTGSEAAQLIEDDPSVFDEYHNGFRYQASGWPLQPLDAILARLHDLEAHSLVVDVGCGDARLARQLSERDETLRTISLDLKPASEWIVAAQCTDRLPLPGGEAAIADVVVCCLSLMGSDWLGTIFEVWRVLRPRYVQDHSTADAHSGRLVIAEVASRFADRSDFIKLIERVGFKKTFDDASNTHFVLFEFKRRPNGTDRPTDLVAAAGSALKPCLYKKR